MVFMGGSVGGRHVVKLGARPLSLAKKAQHQNRD